MKNSLIVLLLLSGCSSSDLVCSTFFYGDDVTVVEGFYKGQTALVVMRYDTQIRVELKADPTLQPILRCSQVQK